MSQAYLLSRMVMAAVCFTVVWHVVGRFIEVNEAGLEFESLGMIPFGAMFLLMGVVSISPTLGKPFFDALIKSAAKHWHHWID